MADGRKVADERIPFNFFKKIPKIVSIFKKETVTRNSIINVNTNKQYFPLKVPVLISFCHQHPRFPGFADPAKMINLIHFSAKSLYGV